MANAPLPDPVLCRQIPAEIDALQAHVERLWTSWSADWQNYLLDHPAVVERWMRMAGTSPWARQQLERHPEWLAAIVADAPLPRPEFSATGLSAEIEFLKALRDYRNQSLLGIWWQDLQGPDALDSTLHRVTRLAEDCLESALHAGRHLLTGRHGQPRDEDGAAIPFVVLGMGKLGGEELNLSSDIDLLFVYGGHGDTDGAHPLDNSTWFQRLGQWLIRALGEVTADGLVFRVDMRLRPFGDAGPLCVTATALEQYYHHQGRSWERYALLKARAVAGDRAFGEHLLQQLQPFLYRRYLDYTALAGLREVKALMDAQQGSASRDIKKGQGGIREIEFICQSLQLIHGGRQAALRQRNTLASLNALCQAAVLAPEDGQLLSHIYRKWRRVEHALQMVEDRQTQELPQHERDWQRLACALNAGRPEHLRHTIAADRVAVHQRFQQLLQDQAKPMEQDIAWSSWQAARHGVDDSSPDSWPPLAHWHDAADTWRHLRRFAQQRRITLQLSPLGQERLDRILPQVLRLCAKTAQPDARLQRFLDFLDQLLAQSAWLALLAENPAFLSTAAGLLDSPWLAREMGHFPSLLDDLLSQRPSPPELWEDELQQLGDQAHDDEERLDGLRRFKNHHMIHLAADFWTQGLDMIDALTTDLSLLAQRCLETALPWAIAAMERQHGPAPGCAAGVPQFVIIAYGKLGGREMGLASDLDLVFLYGGDLEGESQGRVRLSTPAWYARLGQRLIHFLSTLTRAGVLYEIDMRLRPSGQAGPLVSTLPAFGRYQRESAWTWEHQALTRARVLVGDSELGHAFTALRHEILCRPRDPATLAQEVREMRQRIYRAKPIASQEFHPKLSPGGLTDIEFLVQSAILAHSAEDSRLTASTHTLEGIAALYQAGFWDTATAVTLKAAWRQWRTVENQRWLQLESPSLPADTPEGETLAAMAQSVREIGRHILGLWPLEEQ